VNLNYFTLIGFSFYILAIIIIAFLAWLGTISAQTISSDWYANWDNGNDRELRFGEHDPDDDNVELTGIGNAWISGDGTMALSGDAPRFRVVERDYDNVNVTLYAMRINEDRPLSYQGFVIGARSKHYTDDPCYANTYYARLTYNGRVSFEKELFHGLDGGTTPYPHEPSEKEVVFDNGVPRDKWIGLRFYINTINNGTAALLQLYLDKNDNGQWEKVLEYKDTGHWYTHVDDDPCDGYPQNKILLSPGFVFIRNDGLGEAKYRDFSIRELT
jgi:hypothetical protein